MLVETVPKKATGKCVGARWRTRR